MTQPPKRSPLAAQVRQVAAQHKEYKTTQESLAPEEVARATVAESIAALPANAFKVRSEEAK